MYRLTLRGVRGTFPDGNRETLRYGSRTTCFSLHTPQGCLLFDAGTGIASPPPLDAAGKACPDLRILFTHLHLDHVMGLPGLGALHQPGASITLQAPASLFPDWQSQVAGLLNPPFWPLGLDQCAARVRLEDLPEKAGGMEVFGVVMDWYRLPHPQGCLAYRVRTPDWTAVLATDAECQAEALPPALVEFCRKADYLVFDSHFTPAEYPAHRGWGHSSWQTATALAAAADAGRLILTHHAPGRSDDALDRIEEQARALFPCTTAGRENQDIA